MKLRTFWLVIVALAVVRLALMATIPVFEPSEARYAAISANMARSGDFVIPHFTHNLEYQSFDGKPPLVFQAGGLFCEVFGVCEFAVRLFPFLSAVLLLVILYHTVKRFSDAETGRLAVLVCASCTAFYAAAGISMTDMTLTCCVAGALLLYRCFLDGFAIRYAAGVSLLLGAGMIVKGPVALVLFGLSVLADALVNRRWKGVFTWKWLAVAPLFLRKEGLERLHGVQVVGYRQPRMFPVDDAALKKAGSLYNSSLNPACIPGRYMHLDMPRTVFEKDGLKQVPASVTPWIRFPLFWLPLHVLPEWIYRLLVKRVLAHDGYFVTYFHPWEFSSLSKRAAELKVPRLIRFNLGEPMIGRLERLIVTLKSSDAEFIPIRDL